MRGHGEDGAVGVAQHGHRNTSEHDLAPRRPSPGANDDECGLTLRGEPGERIGDRPRAPDRPSNVQNYRLDRRGVGALAGDVSVGDCYGDQLAPREQGRRGGQCAARAVRLVVTDHDGTRCGGLALLGERGCGTISTGAGL